MLIDVLRGVAVAGVLAVYVLYVYGIALAMNWLKRRFVLPWLKARFEREVREIQERPISGEET